MRIDRLITMRGGRPLEFAPLLGVLQIPGIIALGIFSRAVHTGLAVLTASTWANALYATMAYGDFAPVIEGCGVGRLRDGCNDRHRVVSQLTMIPARMLS